VPNDELIYLNRFDLIGLLWLQQLLIEEQTWVHLKAIL